MLYVQYKPKAMKWIAQLRGFNLLATYGGVVKFGPLRIAERGEIQRGGITIGGQPIGIL
jgi:hypothetical protein